MWTTLGSHDDLQYCARCGLKPHMEITRGWHGTNGDRVTLICSPECKAPISSGDHPSLALAIKEWNGLTQKLFRPGAPELDPDPQIKPIAGGQARSTIDHSLKCHPGPFADLDRGDKTFEFRRADRDYGVGDELFLHEFDPTKKGGLGDYTGWTLSRRVTHILSGGKYGVPDGYCVMSLEPGMYPSKTRLDWW